jgi:hypothetical protein
MHATRDTPDFIFGWVVGGRVMRGVRRQTRCLMTGWHISVYRQTDKRASPATPASPRGERLAVWQTGDGGLGWIYGLVKEGKAIDLGGNGYPHRFTVGLLRRGATPPNNGMHPTRDTHLLMYTQRGQRAGDAGR